MNLFLEQEQTFVNPNQNILHIAPEPFLVHRLSSSISCKNYITADLFREDVNIRLDLCDICFVDGYFDLILCNHVLEHIENDLHALSELWRVLSPAGVLLLTIPQDESLALTYEDPAVTLPDDRIREFGQEDHVRIYGRDFSSRLEGVGFRVSVVSGSDFLSCDDIRIMGITESSGKIFVCTK